MESREHRNGGQKTHRIKRRMRESRYVERVFMQSVIEFLSEQPLLYLALVLGIGMLIGHIKFKGISLGAAAVLFAALALTAYGMTFGVELLIPHDVGTFGLIIFAFAIGIVSGPSFFHTMRNSANVILLLILVLVVGALVAFGLGKALGMDIALIAGTFAGATTNTPALAAAGAASGNSALATVGYSISYIWGVLGMLLFAALALNYGKNDTDKPSPLINRTIRVELDDHPTLESLQAKLGSNLQFSRLRRGEDGPITHPKGSDVLYRDDLITVVGPNEDVTNAIEAIGHMSSHSLLADRRYLDFRRVTVSNPSLAGRTISELGLEDRFGATISRVRRGDEDMVGDGSTTLLLGDRARIVAPTARMDEISKFFGDSSRGLSDINPVGLGLGLALGLLIGQIPIPIPGGGTFAIGSAAGALLVGLVMGRLGRIGNVRTALPQTACNVLSELGLLLFLAYAGANAGTQIANAFSSGAWIKILILGFAITTTIGLGLYLTMRYVVKMGGTRLSGLIGGAQTQPAVLAFANNRTNGDPRVALGYAMVYPVAMILKILIAQVLGSF